MPRVRKHLLSPATVWCEDHNGEPFAFQITASDIDHWLKTGNERVARGIKIPCPLEHQAVRAMSAAQINADSVLHNAGWVAGFEKDAKGGLWASLDIEDADLAAKLNTSIKYVSPIIDPFQIDPITGEKIPNCVTQVALTTKPRFTGQEPGFQPVAMSLGSNFTGPVCLSMANIVTPKKNPPRPSAAPHVDGTKKKSDAKTLSTVRHPMADEKPKDEKPGKADVPPEVPDAPETPDAPEVPDAISGEIQEASAALAAMDPPIIVDPSQDAAEFLRHLCTALKNHKAIKGSEKPDELPNPGAEAPIQPKEETPVVAMSTAYPEEAKRLQSLEADSKRKDAVILSLSKKAADNELTIIAGKLDGWVRDGYLTAAKRDAWKTALQAKKLSLVAESPEAEIKKVLDRIAFTEEAIADGAIVKGHFWTPEQKTAALSLVPREETRHEHARFDLDGKLSDDEVKRIQADKDKTLGRKAV